MPQSKYGFTPDHGEFGLTDNHFKGISSVELVVRRPDRNWKPYLPVYEAQNWGFETFGCVTWSALNLLETLLAFTYKLVVNWSDRFTAKMSGTTRNGNSFATVGWSICDAHGLVIESMWPDRDANTFDEFYKEIDQAVKDLGLEVFEKYDIDREYVSPTAESLWEALLYSPVQVCGYAWLAPDANGIYQKTYREANHAFLLVNGEYGKWFEIYDHYDKMFKKLAWDFDFGGAMRYSIETKEETNPPVPEKPMFTFEEGHLYQLVEAPGGFYAFMGGKLRQDDEAKLLMSLIVRNNGDLVGKVHAIKREHLTGHTLYNLKTEVINQL